MLNRTPLAIAVLGAFCAPLAAPTFAFAQSTQPASGHAAPAVAASGTASSSGSAAPVESGMLPAVSVSGQAESQDYQADRSTIGGKTPTALRDIPQSVTVVTKAVLQAQGATSFQDALRNVPGITLGAAEGGTIGNNINLRGFTARTDIYLDGFRDRGQYYRDTFDLESIEVLYGPSSMLFGRGSTGGVINQVSKKPNLKASAEVSASVGTDDRYRSTFDINQPISDTAAFRLDGFGQDLHSSRDVETQKDYGFAPSVRFGIGTPTEVTLSALIEHNNDMPDYGVQALNGHPSPVPKNTFYGLTTDRTIQDVQILSAKVQHKFSDNVTIRNQTQFAHYGTDAIETAPQSVILPNGTALTNGNFTTLPPSALRIQLQAHDRQINDHSIYNTTDVITKFDTGFIKHELITGVEIGRDSYANQAYSRNGLPTVSMIDPAYLSSTPGVTTTLGNLAQASATSLAAYANDTASPGEHWKVIGGLRWDRYRASISNTTSLPGYATQTNNFTSVRAGIIYQPMDWQSYYVSYGTSFDPSLEALTLTNFTQSLPPESNKSYEVGGKWDLLNGNLSLTSALFQVEKTNARTQISATEYELDGNVRVRGYQAGIVGHITDKLQVLGGYTYMDATILQAADGTQGHTPANTPRNTLTLWTTYQITPLWQIGGGPSYMSGRYASNTNYVSVGGYTRWDATVAFHQPKYDVRLNLLNLTNKQYYDALIPSDGGRAVPGIGRALLATLTYRFY